MNYSHQFMRHAEDAGIIHVDSTYQKYLPAPTPEIHEQFLRATGEIAYNATNNYMFQGLLQEDHEALACLICAALHWPRSKIKSLEITNPITLGQYIENKTFILDIKVVLNDDTIVNLEMQLNDYHNWPERSLSYLCRNFDTLNKGDDYSDVKTAIHIGFLDFTLFPNQPEFHAIYKLQNIKNHKTYTDKFVLHVIELNSIHLATDEDRKYEIDKWASFFKAKNWEEIRMLVQENPTLQTAAETLYRLNTDERFRETCERFVRAENEHNVLVRDLADTKAELIDTKAELIDTKAELTDTKAELIDTKSELLKAKEMIEKLKKEAKGANQ